jgi:AP2-associated kinase
MDSVALPMKNGGFEVFILMEHCGGGQLIDFMNQRLETRLSEDQVLTIFSDVCQAIVLMHSQTPTLIHRYVLLKLLNWDQTLINSEK